MSSIITYTHCNGQFLQLYEKNALNMRKMGILVNYADPYPHIRSDALFISCCWCSCCTYPLGMTRVKNKQHFWFKVQPFFHVHLPVHVIMTTCTMYMYDNLRLYAPNAIAKKVSSECIAPTYIQNLVSLKWQGTYNLRSSGGIC